MADIIDFKAQKERRETPQAVSYARAVEAQNVALGARVQKEKGRVRDTRNRKRGRLGQGVVYQFGKA
jgi:hypothetical protein